VHEQYEQAYYKAREVLHLRGKSVGKPTFGDDGIRYCRVDWASLTDRGVFQEAWGDTLANEILRDRAESKSISNGCPECERLWRQFTGATQWYIEVFTNLHAAEVRKDSRTMAELSLLLKDAADRRQGARQPFKNHAATHVQSDRRTACIDRGLAFEPQPNSSSN
jgi:hypothetical protein